MTTEVRNQKEFDEALQREDKEIHILFDGYAHIRYSPHLVARENSAPQIEARGNSAPQIEAWGNSAPQIEAWGNILLRLSGNKINATNAKLSASVMVYLHNDATCKGGIQRVAIVPQNALQWCDFYGARIEGEHAILFKAVDEDYSTDNAREKKIFYAPGNTPSAPDWDTERECGGGLHFSASPLGALKFNSDAKRFVACPVLLDEILVHPNGSYPDKVKAPRVALPCYEVDRFGKRIESK